MGQGIGRGWRPPAPRVERARPTDPSSTSFDRFGPDKGPSTVQKRFSMMARAVEGAPDYAHSAARSELYPVWRQAALLRAQIATPPFHVSPALSRKKSAFKSMSTFNPPPARYPLAPPPATLRKPSSSPTCWECQSGARRPMALGGAPRVNTGTGWVGETRAPA